MPKQTSVNAAYHKVGDPSTTRRSTCSRFVGVIGIVLLAAFVLSLGGSSNSSDSNLRSGQASRSPTAARPPASSSYTDYTSDNSNDGVEGVYTAINYAEAEIESTAEQELQKEQGMLGAAMSSVGKSLRLGLGKMLGGKISDDELESIATEVESRLNENVTKDLRDQADDITREAEDELQGEVDAEMGEGLDADSITSDIRRDEFAATARVRTGIDNAADAMKSSLNSRAAEIEKEILEQRLSQRFGTTVKLVMMDDKQIQGVDALFNDLNHLGGGNGSGNGGYGGSPSYGSGGSSNGGGGSSYGGGSAYGGSGSSNAGSSSYGDGRSGSSNGDRSYGSSSSGSSTYGSSSGGSSYGGGSSHGNGSGGSGTNNPPPAGGNDDANW